MSNTYKIPLFLALIAAGLAGNYANFPIFLDTDFLFGSIFAMLALQLLGRGWGVVAAALIACSTYFLWNHPNAIVTLTAEVAVVGWLMDRRKIGMVLADTLYWLIIGMPLAYILYHLSRHIPFSSDANFLITKMAINGIANTLLARLLYTGFALWSRSSQTSFRDLAYNLLAFFVLCPGLIALAIESRTDFNNTDHKIRMTLAQDSKQVQERLKTWLTNRQTAIINLAEMAASRTPLQMQPFLEQAKKSDLNVWRTALLDRDATITAAYPLLDEMGQLSIGKNFADRPFIPVLEQTLKPMLSEVVIAKIGTPKPIVSILAPVIIQGKYGGYVIGVLSLEEIRQHLENSLDHTILRYTLLDKHGNVIMSSRTDQTVLTPFARDQGTLHRLDAEISQWMPVVLPNTATADRWKSSFYVAEKSVGELAEWKLILEQPVVPFQKLLFREYSGKLTLLFLILLGALALAEVISRRSIVTLEKLALITHHLPIKLVPEGQKIPWPESGIKEAAHLITNFKEMSDSLTAQFKQVQQINTSLEQRVEERTEELRKSEERLALAQKATQDAIWDWDLLTNHLYYSPRWFTMIGYEENELNPDPDLWRRMMHPEDLERANRIVKEALAEKASFEVESRLLHKAGHYVPILTRGFILRDDDATALRVSGTNSDLTERKRNEEAQRQWDRQQQQLQKISSLNDMAGAIAHHFNNQLSVIIGNLEIAIDDLPFDTEPPKPLTDAMRAALKAAEISRKMLTSLGQVTGARAQIDLSEACRQRLPLAQASISENLILTTNLPTLGPIIRANAEQIQQVVTGLVKNAWEAYGDHKGAIELTVKTVSPVDLFVPHRFPIGWQSKHVPYACLEVKDTGCGIAEEDIEKLFDPFFSNKFTGRGLGLPVVLGIVKSYNGAIAVESATGRGSTFRVFLPLAAEENRQHDTGTDLNVKVVGI